MHGLFDLLSGDDLCEKLEHDYRRVTSNGADVFAAFDFLVTAWHLLEWKYPGDTSVDERAALKRAHPILGVCEHLAVGGKHFTPSNPKLTSVAGTQRNSFWKRGMWAPNVWAQGTWKDELVVSLSGAAKDAFGEKLTIPQIAELVMDFWRGPGGCPPAKGIAGSST